MPTDEDPKLSPIEKGYATCLLMAVPVLYIPFCVMCAIIHYVFGGK
jgi:hypothetical protein